MSISSMTNVAFARRRDVPPRDEAPGSIGAIAEEKGDREETQTQATTTLSAIAAYIPTELLTVYLAVVAAMSATGSSVASDWAAFGVFLALAPVVVWLIYAGKVRKAKKTLPLRLGQWPKWEMAAATVAFAAWAFAFPETPFAELSWYNAAIAGVAVLIVTTVLALIAPVVGTLEP